MEPRGGDAEVGALFQAEYRNMVGIARLLVGSGPAAEEVVQEAFVRLLTKWSRLSDPDRAAGYLRSTVVNLARSRLRRRAVVLRHIPLRGREPAEPDEYALADEARGEMAAALRGLSMRQRECLVLRYFAQLTEAETAAALGIAVGSVKSHVHRGLQALEQALKERA